MILGDGILQAFEGSEAEKKLIVLDFCEHFSGEILGNWYRTFFGCFRSWLVGSPTKKRLKNMFA